MTDQGKQPTPTGVISAARVSASGRLKQRSILEVAEEIADLYHRDGVRHFEISGASPLPSDSRAAVRWIGGLKRILRSHEVGRISFGMKDPGSSLCPRVREALVDLGFTEPQPARPGSSPETVPEIRLPLAAG